MKRTIILLIGLLFLLPLTCKSASLDEAVGAYDSGDYSKALEIYKSVIKEKGESAPLLYNLGNVYVKTGDYGEAMLAYRRALLLDPSGKELKANIAYVKSKVDDANKAEAKGKKVSVLPQDSSFFHLLKQNIVFSFLPDTWALWAGITFVVSIACLALYVFSSNVPVRKIGFFGGFIALGVSIITLAFSLMSVSVRANPNEGVVTAFKVNLKNEPTDGAKENPLALTRGTVMNVLSEESNEEGETEWYKVYLNEDFAGWIKAEDFEII
ncbi:MAG: tetratricopeptide repeat protein [Muribaculaceae bacterium]|nr:tetratricopeptide repeat protein [Muribaculaceae bacterium]